MVYGQLFDKASDQEQLSLKKLGMRWKARGQDSCMFTLALTSEYLQEYENQGKWVSNTPDDELNNCGASDTEGLPLGLRTAPVLVLGLDVLGDALRGPRLVLTPFPFGSRVLQR